MKLLSREGGRLVFQLGKRERTTLLSLLKHYPQLSAGQHPMGRPPAEDDPARVVREQLDHSLEEHRAEARRKLGAMLQDPNRFVSGKRGYALQLTAEEVELLLQILGEIRVGGWLALGAPDYEAGEQPNLTPETLPHYWATEMAGEFQSQIIDALNEPL